MSKRNNGSAAHKAWSAKRSKRGILQDCRNRGALALAKLIDAGIRSNPVTKAKPGAMARMRALFNALIHPKPEQAPLEPAEHGKPESVAA